MITAKKGNQEGKFSEEAWELLPVAKDGSRNGWFEVKGAVSIPAEVSNKLEAKASKKPGKGKKQDDPEQSAEAGAENAPEAENTNEG